MIRRRITLVLLAVLGLACSLHAAEPAPLPDGWNARATVAVELPEQSSIDTAVVRIHHAGLARSDGDDFRVRTADGEPVAYELLYHTPDRDSVLAFRTLSDARDYEVLFNNPDAPRDGLRVRSPDQPTETGWLPRAGLFLTTLRRPVDAPNPQTPDAMRKLIAGSPRTDSGALVSNISHALNPFGDSDYYISVYRGWIRIPAAGRYGFCTASNEASFSFIDGRDLVHWPGRHTEQRGAHGEKHAFIELDAGLHYVEYFHEEVLLYQTAFLGWQPPGASRMQGIPDAAFPRPHRARVTGYALGKYAETPYEPPVATLEFSSWPRQRASGQWTCFRFHTDSGGAPGNGVDDNNFVWDFGDGQTAHGRDVRHLYMTAGVKHVTLTQPREAGNNVPIVLKTTVDVFPVEHIQEPWFHDRPPGDPDVYPQLLAAIRPDALPTRDLVELAFLYGEMQQPQQARAAAAKVLERKDADAAAQISAHALLAGDVGAAQTAWLRPDPAVEKLGVAHLRAALALAIDPVQRLKFTARLLRARGLASGPNEQTQQLYNDAQTLYQQNLAGDRSDRVQLAFREVAVARGDAAFWNGQRDQAVAFYKIAESLNQPAVPLQVRVAQIGGFPETIQQFLAANDRDNALATVDLWQQTFPADQVRGDVLFYRANLLVSEDSRDAGGGASGGAARLYAQAIATSEGSPWEAEARYRLAQQYKAMGDDAKFRVTLKALIDSGLDSDWRDKAIEEINP